MKQCLWYSVCGNVYLYPKRRHFGEIWANDEKRNPRIGLRISLDIESWADGISKGLW